MSGAHPQTPTQRAHPMVPDPATPWSPTLDTSPSDTEVAHYWLCTTRCAVHGGVPPLRAAAPSPDPGLVLGPAARQLPSSARPARRARLPADGRAPATPVHTVASGLTIRRPAVGRPPPCETSPEASRRRRGGSSSAQPTIRPYLLQEHKLCLGHGLEEERSIGSPEKLCP